MVKIKPKTGTKLICVKNPYSYSKEWFTIGKIYTVVSKDGIELDDIFWISTDKTRPFSMDNEQVGVSFVEINESTKVLFAGD